jgi:predicted DCC family thiol-disulfide oxidoreductase YuxK
MLCFSSKMTQAPDSPARPPALIVLYDADCGFCTATIRWLQRRDRGGRLTFVALQDAPATAEPWRTAIAGHDLRAALHVVDPASGKVAEGGPAMLAALGVLPRWRVAARLASARPVAPLVDVTYRLVAGHRHALGRLVGTEGPACRSLPVERGRAQ